MPRALDTALNFLSCRTLLWCLGAATLVTALKTGSQVGNGAMWFWWLVLTVLLGGFWLYTWFYCGRDAADSRSALSGEKKKGVAVAAGATAVAAGAIGVREQRTSVGLTAEQNRSHWSQSGKRTDTAATTSPSSQGATGAIQGQHDRGTEASDSKAGGRRGTEELSSNGETSTGAGGENQSDEATRHRKTDATGSVSAGTTDKGNTSRAGGTESRASEPVNDRGETSRPSADKATSGADGPKGTRESQQHGKTKGAENPSSGTSGKADAPTSPGPEGKATGTSTTSKDAKASTSAGDGTTVADDRHKSGVGKGSSARAEETAQGGEVSRLMSAPQDDKSADAAAGSDTGNGEKKDAGTGAGRSTAQDTRDPKNVASGSGNVTGTSSARDDTPKDEKHTGADVGGEEANRPNVLDGPRGGTADDLKKISGVGPKLEGLLHSLGFFHFDQIAAWTDENVAWVDDHLGFKGRISRDDWIGQAKVLAAGDDTQFSKRVERGEVASSKKT